MRINKKSVREVLSDLYNDPELLFMEEFDGCIAGVVRGFDGELVVAYDYHKVIETLMSEGMSEIDAIEYHDYNQAGAYVGKKTPVFIYTLEVIQRERREIEAAAERSRKAGIRKDRRKSDGKAGRKKVSDRKDGRGRKAGDRVNKP